MTRMEQAFNRNTQLFINTMHMLEVQNQSMRQAIDDVVAGTVRMKDQEGTVDWQSYLATFLQKLQEAAAKVNSAVAVPEPMVTSADDEAPLVFGG